MFSKVFENLRAQFNVNSQDESLISLSDRALQDIGLTRGEVIALQSRSKSARLARPAPDTSVATAHPTVLAHAA